MWALGHMQHFQKSMTNVPGLQIFDHRIVQWLVQGTNGTFIALHLCLRWTAYLDFVEERQCMEVSLLCSQQSKRCIFCGTGIGVQVPQRKACSLQKKSNEVVVCSLPFSSFSTLSCCFLQQRLFTSPVFVLLLSKQSRCSGRDAYGQVMQFISPFPLLGRPGEPAAVSPEICGKASARLTFFP